MKPQDFAGREPRLLIEEYFTGRSKAWGIFQDRFGRLRRQFEVEIEGTWDGETLTLVEDFVYDDGETEQRVWRITKHGEHAYEGRADGVVGVATGVAYGNALNWTYRYSLKVGEGTWDVSFERGDDGVWHVVLDFASNGRIALDSNSLVLRPRPGAAADGRC